MRGASAQAVRGWLFLLPVAVGWHLPGLVRYGIRSLPQRSGEAGTSVAVQARVVLLQVPTRWSPQPRAGSPRRACPSCGPDGIRTDEIADRLPARRAVPARTRDGRTARCRHQAVRGPTRMPLPHGDAGLARSPGKAVAHGSRHYPPGDAHHRRSDGQVRLVHRLAIRRAKGVVGLTRPHPLSSASPPAVWRSA